MARKSQGISVTKTTINVGQVVWRVNVQASLAGKRIRRFFNEEAAALAFADDFERRIKEHGIAGVSAGGVTVSDAARRYFAARGKALHGDNARLAHFWLDHFCEFAGTTPLVAISALDLERFWSRKEWAANTRRQASTYLGGFFGWCERHDLIQRNPARGADRPAPEASARAILTPAQMKSLLGAAGVEMRACLCLGGFAGLRTSEILRSKIKIDADEIHVEDGKTGGRYVAILSAFTRNWPSAHLPPSQRVYYRYLATIVEQLGWPEWPENCLRHSFASYHLAMWEDAGKTAYQLGHTSPQMVYKAYARAVKKADAVRWWGL